MDASKEEAKPGVKPEEPNSRHLLVWGTIVVLFLLTCALCLWAMQQPVVQTIWGPSD